MSKTYKNIDYEDYGDYDDLVTFEKLRGGSKKKKKKGHQSKHQNNEYDMYEEFLDEMTPVYIESVVKKPTAVVKPVAENKTTIDAPTNNISQSSNDNTKKPFEFGPNTHELMGNKIDYDRVANMEIIQSEYKGNQTFGIKFTFKGKNANTRVIWYNQRQRERDMIFAQEYKFWLTVRK